MGDGLIAGGKRRYGVGNSSHQPAEIGLGEPLEELTKDDYIALGILEMPRKAGKFFVSLGYLLPETFSHLLGRLPVVGRWMLRKQNDPIRANRSRLFDANHADHDWMVSPHRMLGVDENDDLIDDLAKTRLGYAGARDFAQIILENLKVAGVQQAHKDDRIAFIALAPWPGELVCAEGRYMEGTTERRAAIFIGPEFGTVQRADLVAAAREAGDAGFDVLIACAFNYEARTTEFSKLGRLPVLKARMNADLHMADDLKNTGKGNLFVIFGEPDITILSDKDGQLRVKVNGVDVFKPQTGEVVSDSADGIACWFIDTDYNEESFFVRHAYFLGASDPYNSLKTTLKAEINAAAWATLRSDTSRPFPKPKTGRIAVKVINQLGDEVMKVFKVT